MRINKKQLLKNEVLKKMGEYYSDLYNNQLGLPHYQNKINERLNEEKLRIAPLIERIQILFNIKFKKNMKVLIIGGGTGGEFAEFFSRGCNTYTIEPYDKAIEIIQLKADMIGAPAKNIHMGVAENLPFPDNYFDFIYCYTVIEHVQDVNKSFSEAIRVTKSGGKLFFLMPDYRQIYEGHYKAFLPLFLPKFISKFILILKGRPVKFFNSLYFVNAKMIRNILRKHKVTALQVYDPYLNDSRPRGFRRLERFIQDSLGIESIQTWLVIKH